MVSVIHQHKLVRQTHTPSLMSPPPPPTTTFIQSHRAPVLDAASCTKLLPLSILHMAMYMLQYYSLKSSHRLLPLSTIVCSLCICLLCCPACRTVSIIILNSIYDHMFSLFFRVNMVYHMGWFEYIKESFHPWDKASWPWCISLSMCCWILLSHILLKILHLYSTVILTCNFIYLWYLCPVWYQLAL